MLDLKGLIKYFFIAFFICLLSFFLKSDFLIKYLIKNLITIQITLMAINTATRTVLIAKLQEFKVKYPKTDIKVIIKNMLFSLKEQIILIFISVILIIVKDSNIIEKLLYEGFLTLINDVLLVFVAIYAIDILWDTGKAVFVLIDFTDDINNSKE